MPRGARLAILESPLPVELRARCGRRRLPVIVLAERAEPEDALAAAQLGARALLAEELHPGRAVGCYQGARTGGGRMPHRRAHLTPRQREVLELIVEGLDNTQIAARLGISERTVRAHVSSVLERTGAGNRTQAAVAAIQRGWVATLLLPLVLVAIASAARPPPRRSDARRAAGRARARDARGRRRLRAPGSTTAARAGTAVQWHAAQRAIAGLGAEAPDHRDGARPLGPEARFETAVLAAARSAEGTLDGDLYLRGSGDPSFGTTRARTARRRGRASTGLERVTGRVYGDESFFDRRRGGPASGFGISPYVGPLSALAFNHGTTAPVRPRLPDRPRRVRRRASARPRCGARTSSVGRSRAPATRRTDAPTVATVESPPLAALVRHTNQVSDNYYAEILLKGLGARSGGAGSTAARRARRRGAFTRETGFSSKVADGSGLSRGNPCRRATSVGCCVEARGEPWFDAFYRSLPLAGSDGTLHKRMRGTARRGPLPGEDRHADPASARSPATAAPRTRPPDRVRAADERVNVWAGRRAQDRIAATAAPTP